MLPKIPKAARITELLADLDHLVVRLTQGSYSSDGKDPPLRVG